MKSTAVIVVALTALASSQSLGDIPSCAVSCLTASVSKVTSCASSDFSCICQSDNFSKVQNDATSCVISSCGADTALNQVLPATQKLCAGANQGGGSSATTGSPNPGSESVPTMPASSGHPTTGIESVPIASQPAATNGSGTSYPTGVVTAGAAGFGPAGAIAMLALGALVL